MGEGGSLIIGRGWSYRPQSDSGWAFLCLPELFHIITEFYCYCNTFLHVTENNTFFNKSKKDIQLKFIRKYFLKLV